MKKPIRIKAFWSIYGPKLQMSGRRLDIVSDTDSFSQVAYDVTVWAERSGIDPKDIEFYGPCAKMLEIEFERYNTITA